VGHPPLLPTKPSVRLPAGPPPPPPAGTARRLGSIARHTSSRLVASATEGFKRLAVGDPLLALCKSEPHVPQLALACCTALAVGGGVKAQGIFKEEAPMEEVEKLSAAVGA
jgi:hypothetical protein